MLLSDKKAQFNSLNTASDSRVQLWNIFSKALISKHCKIKKIPKQGLYAFITRYVCNIIFIYI